MSSLDTSATTNADGTTAYTFTLTTDEPLQPSKVREELLASAGFTDAELYNQLYWQADGAICMYTLEDVMGFLETSSEEKAAEWFEESWGSWEGLHDHMCDAAWDYLNAL